MNPLKLLPLLIGLGAGYVLGTRAGREKYDALKKRVDTVWENPRVVKARHDVEAYARQQAPVIRERAEAAAKAAPGVIADAAKDVAATTSTVAKDVAAKTTEVAKDVAASTSAAAKDVASKTSAVAKDVADKTSAAAKDVADKTAKTARTVASKTTSTAKDVRDQAVKTAGDVRERGEEVVGRAAKAAGSARDSALDDGDDNATVEDAEAGFSPKA